MRNKAMEEKLKNGQAKDVSKFRTETGRYLLPEKFAENLDFDFCDAKLEVWIWSIGKEKTSAGRIFASTTGEFYEHPSYICLWLR